MEWETLDPSARTLHVWHWVVDAEANLKAARHINDKLRRQYDEEKVVDIINTYCSFILKFIDIMCESILWFCNVAMSL